jgi:hypothetical protein
MSGYVVLSRVSVGGGSAMGALVSSTRGGCVLSSRKNEMQSRATVRESATANTMACNMIKACVIGDFMHTSFLLFYNSFEMIMTHF